MKMPKYTPEVPMGLLLFIALMAAAIIFLGAAKTETEAQLGKEAPGFELVDHEGNTVSLADYEGKVLVLEWINPDCPFVKRHYGLGTMKDLAEKYQEQDVVWLAVNSTHYMNQETNKKWAEKYELPYPILMDADGSVGRMYGAKTTPHMYIIDSTGKLVYQGGIDTQAAARGPLKDDTVNLVAQALDEVLAEKDVSQSQSKPYGCSVKYKK